MTPGWQKLLHNGAVETGVLLLSAMTVWQLWNGLLADLFHASRVTFLQAAALLIIRNILLRVPAPRRSDAISARKETP